MAPAEELSDRALRGINQAIIHTKMSKQDRWMAADHVMRGIESGKLDKTLEEIAALCNVTPRTFKTWANRGRWLREQRELEQAIIRQANQAQGIKPS